jgi:transcriptional regulator with XRE-family HTH domain
MATLERVKIGQNLKEAREQALMTQRELSEASGVGHDQISRIETDKVDPRFSTIKRLAAALGIDPRELVRR